MPRLSLQIALLDRLVAPRSDKQHEVDWHRPLTEALLGTDAAGAEALMRQHIRESYDAYIDAFSREGRETPGRNDAPHPWI